MKRTVRGVYMHINNNNNNNNNNTAQETGGGNTFECTAQTSILDFTSIFTVVASTQLLDTR